MYVRIALALAPAVLGWYVGSTVTQARYERELHATAVAYAEAQNAAVEAARLDAEAERKRAVTAAEARGWKTAAAQEVIAHASADTDLACEWRDAQRVRIESLYRAYGYPVETDPARVPDSMPDAAESRDGS